MADKHTTGQGDISLAATWGGLLPDVGDTCYIDHAGCTLPDGKTFDIGSTGTLHLGGGGSGTLVCSGACTIIAGTVAEMEALDDSAATDLEITGDCYTTTDTYWSCLGTTTIHGSYTGGGAAAVKGLHVTGDLFVMYGIVGVGGAALGTGIHANAGGTIMGTCDGTGDGVGVSVDGGAEIRGDCTGVGGTGGRGICCTSSTIIGNLTGSATGSGSRGVSIESSTAEGDEAGTATGTGWGIYLYSSVVTGNLTGVAATSYGIYFGTGNTFVGKARATVAASGTPFYKVPSGFGLVIQYANANLPAETDVLRDVWFGESNEFVGTFDEAARNIDPTEAKVVTGTSYKIANVAKIGSYNPPPAAIVV
jgi:hypothetical protein